MNSFVYYVSYIFKVYITKIAYINLIFYPSFFMSMDFTKKLYRFN